MVMKKATAKKPSPETAALRREVEKYLKKNLGGMKIGKAEVDGAMPYVKRHIRKYIDTYWGSKFNPVEMCVQNYLAKEFG